MTLLSIGVAIVLAAGVLAWAFEPRPVVADTIFRWGVPVGCLIGAVLPARVLLASGAWLPAPPAANALFGVDPLSAWFAAIVLGIGAITAMYGVPYLASRRARRSVGTGHLFLALLVIAMTGVVTALSVVTFLAAWECMAVAAYFLIIDDGERAESRRAGFVYLALTHVTTICLLGMFGAWGAGIRGARFHDLAAASAAGHAPTSLVLVLALLGFGIKAGAVPGHFWLPAAHASAPSHASALMSGVMIKTGIYGLLRVLSLVGRSPAPWGWVALTVGLASALLGVLWALTQHDIKRLLAYHSVENIGIIFLGLGVGALGAAYGHPVIALLGFTGALIHTLNHALFKSLLFLGAGVVDRVTGTREIDRLGGLVRIIPRTALTFAIGSAAIVGLPPLNGFISEWLIFRGLLSAGSAGGVVRLAALAAAGLALTGALALACFTKLYGVVFLGTRRQDTPIAPAAERGLLGAQAVLAVPCLLIGVAPIVVVRPALRAAAVVLGAPIPKELAAAVASGTPQITLLGLAFAALALFVWLQQRRGAAAARPGLTWACAVPSTTPRVQSTAAGYAANLLAAFGPLSGVGAMNGPTVPHAAPSDPFIERVGAPLWNLVRETSEALRRVQTRRIRWYLLYVIAALTGLLVYLWLGARQ